MRIIAGKNKGKVLVDFKLETTRPTSDLVKGALFNIIAEKIVDCEFLDLFGGTGSISCEAVSRGASSVITVDNNNESIKIIKKNLSLINANNVKVLNSNFVDALKQFIKNKNKFDIIFLDPPYKTDFAEQSIEFILKNNLLKENGLLIWEHDEDKLNLLNNYGNFKTKKYGKKYLSIYQI